MREASWDTAGDGEAWVRPSELGEYAFCPRSWWYSRHPDSFPGRVDTTRGAPARARGLRVHGTLERRHVRAQEGSGVAYALLFAAASVLLVLGTWWFLR